MQTVREADRTGEFQHVFVISVLVSHDIRHVDTYREEKSIDTCTGTGTGTRVFSKTTVLYCTPRLLPHRKRL